MTCLIKSSLTTMLLRFLMPNTNMLTQPKLLPTKTNSHSIIVTTTNNVLPDKTETAFIAQNADLIDIFFTMLHLMDSACLEILSEIEVIDLIKILQRHYLS